MGKMPLQKWIINMRMVEKRLGRQTNKMRKEEAKIMREIKKAIENDDMETARLFAKDVARNRRMIHNLQRLRSQVKGIGYKLEQASAIQAVGRDLKGLVKSLAKVNRRLAIPQMERILYGMENEMEMLNLTTETMEEGFESIGEGDDLEVDSEANKIIEEFQTATAAKTGLPATPTDTRAESIEERLQKLKDQKK